MSNWGLTKEGQDLGLEQTEEGVRWSLLGDILEEVSFEPGTEDIAGRIRDARGEWYSCGGSGERKDFVQQIKSLVLGIRRAGSLEGE